MRTRSKGSRSPESTSGTTKKRARPRKNETLVDEDAAKHLDQKKKQKKEGEEITLPDELCVKMLQEIASLRKELEEQKLRVKALEEVVVEQKKNQQKKKKEALTLQENDVVDVEQQQQNKRGLPDELWEKVLESVDDNSVMAFASVNKQLRRVQQASGRWLETNLSRYNIEKFIGILYEEVSEGWCIWALSLPTSAKEEERRTRRIMNAAALHGHLKEVLKKWKDPKPIRQKILFGVQTCASAALGGCLELLMWLRDNGCPWNASTCSNAALGGHLEVLKYAHEKGCKWNALTCSEAAEGGHLEVLKYAHENGCPWNEWTCYAAARRGHFEVLKYAHEKGCPWNGQPSQEAARRGHLEVLKYAHEKDYP